MEIFRSRYQVHHYQDDDKMLYNVWTTETVNMNGEIFKEQEKSLLDNIASFKPKYILSDGRDFNFPISPIMQQWMNEEAQKIYQGAQTQRIAIVLPIEFISQLSVTQFFDAIEPNQTETRYFSSINEAKHWLFNS